MEEDFRRSGIWPAVKPSRNWPLICALIGAMLFFVGVLVYLLDKANSY